MLQDDNQTNIDVLEQEAKKHSAIHISGVVPPASSGFQDSFFEKHSSKTSIENFAFPITKMHIGKPALNHLPQPLALKEYSLPQPATVLNAPELLRLCVKKGEYVYARPNDIVLLESCDHLVKVYLAHDDKLKKTVRSSTLKDFLLQLPSQFVRIGRFCAVNSERLSGGNYNEQTFEFDFKVCVKLKHPISQTLFNTIGK